VAELSRIPSPPSSSATIAARRFGVAGSGRRERRSATVDRGAAHDERASSRSSAPATGSTSISTTGLAPGLSRTGALFEIPEEE
jgi:hypothetical protein